MRPVKKILFLFLIIVLYAILLFWGTTFWIHVVEEESTKKHLPIESIKPNKTRIPVEVWGKASISMYFWIHIFKGPTQLKYTGYTVGNLTTDDFEMSFKNGPSVVPSTVPLKVKYLVIILNGRAPDKIKFAKMWLDFLKSLSNLKRTVLLMLGSEQCENDWLLPYMKSRGGVIDVAFLVYDSLLVDDKEFYQWPLGVAEYRGFPDIPLNEVIKYLLSVKRPHVANFFGTVYKNSSREFLVEYVKTRNLTDTVYLDYRNEWVQSETKESRESYMKALRESELTLSPVGMNAECYRIYEAMSLGSVPVVEDRTTRGKCDTRPLRLLKQYEAPVIWLKDWTQLPDLLHRQSEMSQTKILNRRIHLVSWHERFKLSMKARFLNVLKNLILS